MNGETGFEKPRGVSAVETREGYAQVHVSRLAEPLMAERLRVLKAVADAGVSIDFLKLTHSGLSFLVEESRSVEVSHALEPLGVHATIRRGRSVVIVSAVNIRDEEGLIARILQTVIASGVQVDHVSDMHDRILLTVGGGDASRIAEQFRDMLIPSDREAAVAN